MRLYLDPVTMLPPLPNTILINLAIVNREELHHFMLASLSKSVGTILAPLNIEQLLVSTQPGEKQQCVLVEGAPMVGKTTLSCEICKQWAEGKLFQQFSLVLLLRLRDETVQNAKTVRELITYPFKERLEGIAQHLKDEGGTNTLILLDGMDELPQHLLTQPSMIMHLLAGTELPNATVIVTSQPFATTQLWENCGERISRYIEILGFTEENITAYVASILDPDELPDFNTYLCTATGIREMMYIPLHSGIIAELYRIVRNSDRPLPTNKTALFTRLVQIILAMCLKKYPKYKDDNIEVEQFTDLPADIYPVFKVLTELAYNSIKMQQPIFKDGDQQLQYLGFMDVVAELFPYKRRQYYSYKFLHLNIQEYLGAIYMSHMDTSTQVRLVESMCRQQHLKNMSVFLVAITKFKGRNWEIVKRITQSECNDKDGILTLSNYAMQIVFESEDVSLLEGHSHYTYELHENSPLFEFATLGYCIATSSFKWKLQLGNLFQVMKTTSGIELLLHALHHHSTNIYTIDNVRCHYKETEVVQKLLVGLPQHNLPLIEVLGLYGDSITSQPPRVPRLLPQCLPELIHKMNRLRVLTLWNTTAVTLADTLQALAAAPTYALEMLNLSYSPFSTPVMQALHRVLLRNSKSMTELALCDCEITDEQACFLATTLNGLPKLRKVDLRSNFDIGRRGHAALDGCNKHIEFSSSASSSRNQS